MSASIIDGAEGSAAAAGGMPRAARKTGPRRWIRSAMRVADHVRRRFGFLFAPVGVTPRDRRGVPLRDLTGAFSFFFFHFLFFFFFPDASLRVRRFKEQERGAAAR